MYAFIEPYFGIVNLFLELYNGEIKKYTTVIFKYFSDKPSSLHFTQFNKENQ